jgi:glycerophosphoryl diester phosphodiesterase
MPHKTTSLLLLVFCLSFHAFSQDPGSELLYVGHRGASYLAPENTLASMALAWERGADAAECDVMLTADYRVVVFHDRNTRKLTGTCRSVRKSNYVDLEGLEIRLGKTNEEQYRGQKIPLLEEVLAMLPADKTLVIEMKDGTEILPHLKFVMDRHWRQGKVVFIAFDFDCIRQCKAIYPEVPCYYLSASGRDARKHVEHALKAGLDGLDLRHKIIDREMAGLCREAGLDLWCWTVNDPETARWMKALGVSAVTTDRPAWLKARIREQEGGN